MTTSDSDQFSLTDQQINVTTCNKTVTFKIKENMCLMLLILGVISQFLLQRDKQKPGHYIANMIQYHMTLSLTNNIWLQLCFPQNETNYKKHYSPKLATMSNFISSAVSSSNPFPNTLP